MVSSEAVVQAIIEKYFTTFLIYSPQFSFASTVFLSSPPTLHCCCLLSYCMPLLSLGQYQNNIHTINFVRVNSNSLKEDVLLFNTGQKGDYFNMQAKCFMLQGPRQRLMEFLKSSGFNLWHTISNHGVLSYQFQRPSFLQP